MSEQVIAKKNKVEEGSGLNFKQLALAAFGLLLWGIIYNCLAPFAQFLTYSVIGIDKGSHLGEALQFFFMIPQRF